MLVLALFGAGCARKQVAVTTFSWVLGGSEPAFDPHGPPDARRWALERLLTYGLVAEDSAGRIAPAAAESVLASADSLTWTFRLRDTLAYTDGTPCRSEDFRRALVGGLTRSDHSTQAWLLAAVTGVDAIRPDKPLPALGIEAPDDRTLVLHLARRDVLLLQKLAVPGVTDAWSERSGTAWKDATGLGPFRVALEESGRRLRLVPAHPTVATQVPDTVLFRFGLPAGRVRALLRESTVDLVWPMPVGTLDEALPPGYRTMTAPPRPRRQLLLVMRADLPPTTKLAARQALAHGINRDDMVRLLGPGAERRTTWLMNAQPGDFPPLDGDEILRWMDRGQLGRSFHVDMAFRGDGPGAAVARSLQGEWSRFAIYVEPHPLRGERWTEEALSGLTHLTLVESQAVVDDPSAELAQVVMPLRGPPVGAWRTGWRTRGFEPWITPRAAVGSLPIDEIEQRLEEELVVLPLAELPWVWIERDDRPRLPLHPHFGPHFVMPPVHARTRVRG